MLKHLKLIRSVPDPRSLEVKPVNAAEFKMSYTSGEGLGIEEFDTHFSLKSKTKTVCVPISAAEFWIYEDIERPRQSSKDSPGSGEAKSPKRKTGLR